MRRNPRHPPSLGRRCRITAKVEVQIAWGFLSFDPAVGLRNAFGPLLLAQRRGYPAREKLFELLQNWVPARFCIWVLQYVLELALDRVEEVIHLIGQVRQFVIVNTDCLCPCGQGVTNGSPRLGQCVGGRLRGSAGTILRTQSTTPELAERLVWND